MLKNSLTNETEKRIDQLENHFFSTKQMFHLDSEGYLLNNLKKNLFKGIKLKDEPLEAKPLKNELNEFKSHLKSDYETIKSLIKNIFTITQNIKTTVKVDKIAICKTPECKVKAKITIINNDFENCELFFNKYQLMSSCTIDKNDAFQSKDFKYLIRLD